MPGTTLVKPRPGNRLAVKHNGFVTKFTPAEISEIRELEDQIRPLVPLQSPTIEPAISVLAGALWRRSRLYDYLDQHGFHRGRTDREQLRPAVEVLGQIEGRIIDVMKTLGMTPKAAADLNLSLAKLESARRFDFERLSPDEKATFSDLVAKAETAAEEWDAA
jgi:hypothetical protein